MADENKDERYELQLIEENSLDNWLRYYWYKQSAEGKVCVLRRSVRALPRSYKLWCLYLDHLVEVVGPLCPVQYSEEYGKVCKEFELCLRLLNKLPLIWVRYLEFAMSMAEVTWIRRLFNRALRTLPLTQHHLIWPVFLRFADEVGGLTGGLIYHRYYTYDPSQLELVVEKLQAFKQLSLAAPLFETLINDDSYVSNLGKSPLDLWLEYFSLLTETSTQAKVDQIVSFALVKFPDQQGKLFVQWAMYYIKLRDYTRASIIFEDALKQVSTIKDFTMIYDSFAQFQDKRLSKLVASDDSDPQELDYRIACFEKLMDSRENLLDDVKIRQDVNNVDNWIHKASLTTDLRSKIQIYVDALTKIDPQRATSGLSKIWISYATIYEENNDLETAKTILDKAVKVKFNSPDELSEVWIHWSELELSQDDLPMAIKVMEVATRLNPKIPQLWGFYLDLVESTSDVEATCAIYEQLFTNKMATPLHVINYANFLEENKFFERALSVYAKGVTLFKYPVVFEIWNIYLTKAIQRQLSLERMRDLFDQSLDACPEAKDLYVLYSKYEEENGSIQRSLKIINNSLENVKGWDDKLALFKLAIQLCRDKFGVPTTREWFTKAVESLPPSKCIEVVIEFAKFETSLHELARARHILQHGAMLQSVDKSKDLWEYWNDLEITNGDKQTFKEMLQWKRRATDEFGLSRETKGFINDGRVNENKPEDEQAQQSVENPDAIDIYI